MNELIENVAVSVCMSTYNHDLFIEQALSSVLDQECTFDYEIILSNDASSDKTHEVILKFIKNHPLGHKIKYFNQDQNLGINKNLIFTLEQAKGKYIALLEGDDYWTNKTKLQKQCDFLENNPDYTICTAAYETIEHENGYLVRRHEENTSGVTYSFDNFAGFRAHYLNMFFLKKALEIQKLRSFEYSGDNVIFIMCLSVGKGYFFNEVFGFRREHINGAWSSKTLGERLKMSSAQFEGLYKFSKYKKVVRPILYYYYADLIGEHKRGRHYIFSTLKLVRTPKEFIYFLKRIVSYYLSTKSIN